MPNPIVFANTFASTASNYSTSGASSTLSTMSMSVVQSTGVWAGGTGVLQVAGTFNGGTVTMGYVDPIGNSVSVLSVSAPTSTTFLLPNNTVYLSGATTAAGRTIAANALYFPTNIG